MSDIPPLKIVRPEVWYMVFWSLMAALWFIGTTLQIYWAVQMTRELNRLRVTLETLTPVSADVAADDHDHRR